MIHSAHGRVAGKQSNDAAETSAILQALLSTHPRDKLRIYCDNQGCVDVWKRVMREKKVSMHSQKRALWARILELAMHREETGQRAIIQWVHSHVDDEARRTNVSKAKY